MGMSRGRGRGKWRGRSNEGVLPTGEPAPPPILQPPPLYPTLDRRPLELKSSDIEDYLMIIKQDFKASMSPYHFTKTDPKSGAIARYLHKFRKNGEGSGDVGWDINWNYFPMELKIGGKTKRLKSNRGKRTALDDNPPKAKKRRRVKFDENGEGRDGEGLAKKLDTLEKAEQSSAESEQSAEEENAEEVYNEYEDEEGTDYNLTYFDNGEDYEVGDDEALEEGPVY